MSAVRRSSVWLPVLALVAALAVVGVQLAAGGADYAPTTPADPCKSRALPAPAPGIEAVTEQVVLLGLQNAACTLGVTREQLVLALPSERDRLALARESGRSEAGLVTVLRNGLDRAVVRLDRAGRLPKASSLLDSYVGNLGLPGVAEAVIRRLPDGIVNGLLPTGQVLRNALDRLDVEQVLSEINNPDALQRRLQDAIKAAAVAQARARLLDQIPGPLRAMLGL